MTDSFSRAGEQIAARIGDVFNADVTVFDAQGELVTRYRDEGAPPDGAPCRRLRMMWGMHGHDAGCIVVSLCRDNAAPEPVVRAFVELLVHDISLSEAYRPEQDLRNAFVLGLLRGESLLDPDTIRYADTLGMDLTRPRAVVLIDASEYILAGGESVATLPGRDRIRARAVIESIVSFFRLPSDAICAYIGSGEIALLKASSSQDLDP